MSCPPGNCSAWAAFRLCKPLPPIVIDGSYTAEELQLLWFCWRARSTGEYGGSVPVDLGFNSPGLIDISQVTNMDKIIAYCESRGTLVRQFTNFSRFGSFFNLPNLASAGSFSTWSGGTFGPGLSPGISAGGSGDGGGGDEAGGGTYGGGSGGTCPCTAPGGALTVVVCTELDCESGFPKVELTVCGGTPPYQWSVSGFDPTPTAVQSGGNNRNVVVTPLATEDNFAGVTAYAKMLFGCITDAVCLTSPNTNFANWRFFDCAGDALSTCQSAPDGGEDHASCNGGRPTIRCIDGDCADGGCGSGCGGSVLPFDNDPEPCGTNPELDGGVVCDKRTQAMKDDVCQPCEVQMNGGSITVEDDVGATVVTVITL